MSRVLVVYGTTDGQTAKISQTIRARLAAGGHDVAIFDAAGAPSDITTYDAAVVAASVHAGGYQRDVKRWVGKHADALRDKPNAFVSVCLGVLQQQDPNAQQELQRILERFFETTGWRPAETKIVAGALKYTKYNFLKRWVMKRIVAKAGGETDTSRDYEYTDWPDLNRFADRFGARARATSVGTPA